MAGARQRETAARQEAGGAEPRNVPTNCPSAVSENGGDESRTHQHTCARLYPRAENRAVRAGPVCETFRVSHRPSDTARVAAAVAHVRTSARGGAIDPSWRVTVHFHPDRLAGGVPILRAMAADGRYRSQFET